MSAYTTYSWTTMVPAHFGVQSLFDASLSPPSMHLGSVARYLLASLEHLLIFQYITQPKGEEEKKKWVARSPPKEGLRLANPRNPDPSRPVEGAPWWGRLDDTFRSYFHKL